MDPLKSSNLPTSVRLVEVGPRDGLQNEPTTNIVSIDTKVELINRLSSTGLTNIESGSFVSPKWVPQMANSLEVFNRIKRNNNVTYSALVPNIKGFKSALKASVDEIAIFSSASEKFCQRNLNCSILESIEMFTPVVKLAEKCNIPVRGYIGCSFGCPYEGKVSYKQVSKVADLLYNKLNCYEIVLGDTIGISNPQLTLDVLKHVNNHVPINNIGVHFHNTYNQALSNILISLQYGINIIDSSISGLGGCPFAKGATGNIATEDVLFMLNGLNIKTGIDFDKIIDTSVWISNKLNKICQSNVTKALKRSDLSKL